MASRRTKIWAGLIVGLAVAIQFVPVDRSNPPVRTVVDAPPAVDSVIRRACWDCHSNETEWPWYAYVAPVSWYVADDVHEARSDMNFTDWPAGDPDEVQDLIEEIGEQIEADAMPPNEYRWMHPEARLTEGERQRLIDWSYSRGGLDRLDELEGMEGGGR